MSILSAISKIGFQKSSSSSNNFFNAGQGSMTGQGFNKIALSTTISANHSSTINVPNTSVQATTQANAVVDA
ncbi:hypothetical protein DFA_06461 [Cavenderia fasciculata]|uniref:Uncharacterized protein n=1 Tax=Cavenderia fasciculata TaxID=261658 RepID=F4PJ25_CACFS|nr:uncharacterized protein DFA_06461 [Cavenderia fasciculata]EGG24311.1 hypothetical protein DFA_06461 [Cavenderia fasciculata]|eukprot:XP_004362162.1 hypothetical protein DFA_06461 [Cavenderia fasciculata]